MSLINNDLFRFDNFELQPSRRTLLRAGEKVPVAPKTFEVLLCLVRQAGRVVLKDQIFNTVWPGSFIEEGNLTQHIFWVRKALGDKAGYVVTIPGRGYEFTGQVETLPETVVAPSVKNETALPAFTIERTIERSHIVVEETLHPSLSSARQSTRRGRSTKPSFPSGNRLTRTFQCLSRPAENTRNRRWSGAVFLMCVLTRREKGDRRPGRGSRYKVGGGQVSSRHDSRYRLLEAQADLQVTC